MWGASGEGRGQRLTWAAVFAVCCALGWASGPAADQAAAARAPGTYAYEMAPEYWGEGQLGQATRLHRATFWNEMGPNRRLKIVAAAEYVTPRGTFVVTTSTASSAPGQRPWTNFMVSKVLPNGVLQPVAKMANVQTITLIGQAVPRSVSGVHAENLLAAAGSVFPAQVRAQLELSNTQVEVLSVEARPCAGKDSLCRVNLPSRFPNLTKVIFNSEAGQIPGAGKADTGAKLRQDAIELWEPAKDTGPNYTASRAAYKDGELEKMGASKTKTVYYAPPIPDDGTGPGKAPGPSPKFDPNPGVAKVPGGIDLSTVDLRYVADPGPEKSHGPQLAYAARATKGDQHEEQGLDDLVQANNTFYVMLTTTPDKLWVNLNPTEPDRIIDPVLGRTDAGRVLLEADLQMKKTVAKLIHPDSSSGKGLWSKLSKINPSVCVSFRQWITPATATLRDDGDGVFLVSTPLRVQLESDYVKDPAASTSCPSVSADVEARSEAVLRKYLLPRVQTAVNSAPEYAALRRVYRSRVAAEWYRQHSLAAATTYGDYIDRNATSYWPSPTAWSPTSVFDAYKKSYENGEFKIKRKTRKGGYITTRTYVYGGVDLSQVPISYTSSAPVRHDLAVASLTRPTADGKGSVWLSTLDNSRYVDVATSAAVTASPAPGSGSGSGSGGGGSSGRGWWSWWYLLLLPELWLVRRAYLLRQRRVPDRLRPNHRNTLILLLTASLVVATAVVIDAQLGTTKASTTTTNRPPDRPRTSIVKALAPAPEFPVPEPALDVQRVPVPTPPPDTNGHDAGTCLAGKKLSGSGPAPKLTEVPCSSGKARYKVIKKYLNEFDLNRCNKVRGTRYAYSEQLLVNHIPTKSVVYCLKNA